MTAEAVAGGLPLTRRARVIGGPPAQAPAEPRTRTRERAQHLHSVPATGPATTTRTRTAKARTRTAPRANPLRYAARIVYRDTADGWIVQSRTLSIADVWNINYAVPDDWTPFRVWCKVYTRSAGVAAAAVLDGVKWFLIHPVRGPLLITGSGAAYIASHFIH